MRGRMARLLEPTDVQRSPVRIFRALHERHVEDVHGVIAQALAQATVEGVPSLDVFTGRLVAGLAELHAAEPELHELISEQLPEGPAGFRRALREIFAQLTSSKRMLFVLPHVIEALVHGIAEQRRSLPAAALRDEAVETALTCLASCQKA